MKRLYYIQLTANECLSVKHLDAAIEAFNAATKAAGLKTDLFTNGKLPQVIWFNFYGITVERAQHIADETYKGIEGAEQWQAETLQRLEKRNSLMTCACSRGVLHAAMPRHVLTRSGNRRSVPHLFPSTKWATSCYWTWQSVALLFLTNAHSAHVCMTIPVTSLPDISRL